MPSVFEVFSFYIAYLLFLSQFDGWGPISSKSHLAYFQDTVM